MVRLSLKELETIFKKLFPFLRELQIFPFFAIDHEWEISIVPLILYSVQFNFKPRPAKMPQHSNAFPPPLFQYYHPCL